MDGLEEEMRFSEFEDTSSKSVWSLEIVRESDLTDCLLWAASVPFCLVRRLSRVPLTWIAFDLARYSFSERHANSCSCRW